MKKIFITLTIIFSLVFVSCQKTNTYKDKLKVSHEHLEPQEIIIKNYSKALFSLDTANFAEEIRSIQNEFPIFLEGDLYDINAVNYIKSFATDTFCIRINKMAEEKFSDTRKLSNDIKSVYQLFKHYYPNINIPEETYLYVSGIDYNTPSIMIFPNSALISMDLYLSNESSIYDYIGMPRYRSYRCQPSFITRDLAESLYSTYIYKQQYQKDVLSEMIDSGKRLFFIEALNPSLPDSVLMGYTSKQMKWVKEFESDIWATMVGNDLLYAKGADVFRNLFGDGPFTQAFSNEAPARLGEYIGLQIIRSYMTNNDASLQEMLNNKDIQQIFQTSQYKPKRS
ncbi:MAG: hypothetical protein IKU01_07710 [Bacteroidales bacterium]|nr:hypothetical protein [Bacteroidales bacterium]